MDDVGPENMETLFETLFTFFESAGITDYEALRSFDAGNMLRTLYSVTDITEDVYKRQAFGFPCALRRSTRSG